MKKKSAGSVSGNLCDGRLVFWKSCHFGLCGAERDLRDAGLTPSQSRDECIHVQCLGRGGFQYVNDFLQCHNANIWQQSPAYPDPIQQLFPFYSRVWPHQRILYNDIHPSRE